MTSSSDHIRRVLCSFDDMLKEDSKGKDFSKVNCFFVLVRHTSADSTMIDKILPESLKNSFLGFIGPDEINSSFSKQFNSYRMFVKARDSKEDIYTMEPRWFILKKGQEMKVIGRPVIVIKDLPIGQEVEADEAPQLSGEDATLMVKYFSGILDSKKKRKRA
jgi:hypothetical protein